MSFKEYLDLSMKYLPCKGNKEGYSELKRKVRKLNTPYSEGSTKRTARARIQDLNLGFEKTKKEHNASSYMTNQSKTWLFKDNLISSQGSCTRDATLKDKPKSYDTYRYN